MSKLEIRFYDNEESNWENDMILFSDEMEFIHVNEYEPNKLIETVSAPEIDNTSNETILETIRQRNHIFISAYINYFAEKNNTYALYLQENINNNVDAGAEILKQQSWEGVLRLGYPNNGLHIEELCNWVQINSQNKVVLTDWDRTITVCEGMYFGSVDGILTKKVEDGIINIEDLLVYLMGGNERLEKIKDMLKKINNSRVPLYILTHNRNASVKKWAQNRKLYIIILQVLMPYKTIQEIEDILFSSADYISMKSIRIGDLEGSYRKYKSTCSIHMVKDILKECNQYFSGGKKKRRCRKIYTIRKKHKCVKKRKKSKRIKKLVF